MGDLTCFHKHYIFASHQLTKWQFHFQQKCMAHDFENMKSFVCGNGRRFHAKQLCIASAAFSTRYVLFKYLKYKVLHCCFYKLRDVCRRKLILYIWSSSTIQAQRLGTHLYTVSIQPAWLWVTWGTFVMEKVKAIHDILQSECKYCRYCSFEIIAGSFAANYVA